uniref:Transmembrane protein n=1 Tax=Globodera rostochiensis TaxID=31243 RepID=A0A914GX89_GLORO
MWVNFFGGLAGVSAVTHASIYFAYGPEHPRCMSRWKEMKQRGQLSQELLWKERLLYARRREFMTALAGYGKVDTWRHPKETMAATSSPRHII